MDKRPNKIVVKINGKEKDYKTEEQISFVPANHRTESAVEEHMLKNSEKDEEEFSWVLPNYENEQVVSIEDLRNVKVNRRFPFVKDKHKLPQRKENGTGFVKKIAFIVSGAVLLGTALGMFSVKMMTGSDVTLSPRLEKEVAVPEVPRLEEEAVKGTPAAEQETNKNSEKAEVLPGFEVFVVQAGVFSSKSGGVQAVKEMKEKGYPAVTFNNNQNYLLFVGIGTAKDETKSIANYYKGRIEATYVKSYIVPKNSLINPDKGEAQVMKKGQRIFRQLLSLSSKAASQSSQTKNNLSDVRNELIRLKGEKVENEQIDAFITRMFMALEMLSAYEDSKDESNIWKSQQYLLDAFVIYDRIK